MGDGQGRPAGGGGSREQALEERAAVLVEALPYLRRFAGSVIVVKHGGAALEEAALHDFAEDVALLALVGLRLVVVHGGGPQIGQLMSRLGRTPVFVDGQRVTDAETLEIARMVLVGSVNRRLVGAVNRHGPVAVGVSGEDAGLVRARPHSGELGFVGVVDAIDPRLLHHLLDGGLVPVVATIGVDRDGQAYNINADAVAAAVAAALGAERAIFLTDVDGIRRDPKDPATRIGRLGAAELAELRASGVIEGGMRPKVDAILAALAGGVRAAHVLDGRTPHSLLVELLSDEGAGTMVVP